MTAATGLAARAPRQKAEVSRCRSNGRPSPPKRRGRNCTPASGGELASFISSRVQRGHHVAVADHRVVRDADIHRGERRFEALCDLPVGGRGLRMSRRVVVRKDDGCRGGKGQSAPTTSRGWTAQLSSMPRKQFPQRRPAGSGCPEKPPRISRADGGVLCLEKDPYPAQDWSGGRQLKDWLRWRRPNFQQAINKACMVSVRCLHAP